MLSGENEFEGLSGMCVDLVKLEKRMLKGGAGISKKNQLKLVQDMLELLESHPEQMMQAGSLFSSAFKAISNRRRRKDPKSRELLDGEVHCPKMNFSGPGTRIDLPEVLNTKPYNDVDAAAKQHDLDYDAASKLPRSKQVAAIKRADAKLLKAIEPFKDQKGYKCTKLGIKGKLALERFAPSIAKKVLGETRTGVN